MESRFLEHLRELSAHLAGKDPRRAKVKARGSVLLMLADTGTGALERVAIDIGAKSVEVSSAVALPDDDDTDLAVVHATLEDWLAFYRNANDATLSKLRLHGDVDLLSMVGELLVAPRQAQDVRSGGAR